jgi:hypothetical protein
LAGEGKAGSTRFLELGHAPPAISASAKLLKLLREEVFPCLED